MRCLPMMSSAALLLSAGLLVSTGPTNAAPALTLDRSAVADMLLEKAGATTTAAVTTDHTLMAIDLTGPITAMATDGHILVMDMDMDVVGATDARRRPASLN